MQQPQGSDVDIDWDLVDPVDVTSLRMAMDFGLDGKRQGSSATPLALTHEQEEDRRAFFERIAAEDTLLAEQFAQIKDQDVGDVDELGDEEEVDEEDGAENVEEEGMEADGASPSREELFDSGGGSTSEEYIVEEVLGRRRVKGRGKVSLESRTLGEMEEDELEWEYLVRWRGGGGADGLGKGGLVTWESRHWLFDQGWKGLVDDYDSGAKPYTHGTSTRRNRPQKPPTGGIPKKSRRVTFGRMEKAMDEWLVQDPELYTILHRALFFHAGPPQSLLLRIRNFFLTQSLQQLVVPLQIYPVGNCGTRSAFLNFVSDAKNMENRKIVLRFHGTHSMCVSGICSAGLRVPGTNGVAVRNGSALGVGIYSAVHTNTSTSYCCSKCIMFLCAGISSTVQSSGVLLDNASVTVYFQSHLIVPLFAVKYQLISLKPGSTLLSLLPTMPVPTLCTSLDELLR
jgi:hypothetical protein